VSARKAAAGTLFVRRDDNHDREIQGRTLDGGVGISDSDSHGLLWVSFKPDDEAIGALSLHAASVAGRAVMQWRDMQSTALAKAVLARASKTG
jgi:hypothetical protein